MASEGSEAESMVHDVTELNQIAKINIGVYALRE